MKELSEHRREAGPALCNVRQRDAVRIPMLLTFVALGLAALHVGVDKLSDRRPDLVSEELLRFVDLGQEANLPTWFTTALWLAAALVAFSIWRVFAERGYPHRGYWAGMVPLFLFLSADEAGKIHEAIGGFISGFADFSGFFTYAWVIFGVAFAMTIGAIYVRLLLLLRPGPAIALVTAALIFLSGSVGVESIWAAVDKGHLDRMPFGQSHLRMIVYEETLEMLGIVLLIYVLLKVLAGDRPPYRTTG